MPPREILIVKLGALGDVARTTGLLAPLRRRHAPCRVSWLTRRDALPLLSGLPLDRAAALGSPAARRLRDVAFDLVVCMDEEPAAARAAASMRAKRRVGAVLDASGRVTYTPDTEPVFGLGLLARDRRAADRRKRSNRASYQRLWVRALGLTAADRHLRPLLPGGAKAPSRPTGPVAVHAGSGKRWPSKRLPVSVAAAIVSGLAAAGLSPELVTGPSERRRNAAIVRLAGAGRVGPARSLTGLARWLAGCRALVTTDSLPMHLALAAGVPCVALFGPTSAAEIATFGPAVKMGPRPPCGCFYRPTCPRGSCLRDLDPVEVVRRARGLCA